jgi:hypothetical protein
MQQTAAVPPLAWQAAEKAARILRWTYRPSASTDGLAPAFATTQGASFEDQIKLTL